MRRFGEEYLSATRAGMWADRSALADLRLGNRQRVLDVGAGTGEFTRVLREEVETGASGDSQVVAVDADPALLDSVPPPLALGDATRLPVRDDAADLVVCQALLVNLDDPGTAVTEFERASSDLVAAIEPDNSAVTVESSVEGEAELARRARELYLRGATVDPALGPARGLFEGAGLSAVTVRRYDQVRATEPPYSEAALESARRKASGAGIDSDRETLLAAGLDPGAFDALRDEWRAVGRRAIAQMRDGEYRRRETVPFHVTVGQV